ncbi:unnamed protein product [Gadus morhua 'NCC']
MMLWHRWLGGGHRADGVRWGQGVWEDWFWSTVLGPSNPWTKVYGVGGGGLGWGGFYLNQLGLETATLPANLPGAREARQAYGATRLPSSPGELTAEDQESEGNGPSPGPRFTQGEDPPGESDDDDGVWDCEVAAICLLLHLLPPTSKGKKSAKISATDATVRLVKFLKVGRSMETFLKETGPAQPFLLVHPYCRQSFLRVLRCVVPLRYRTLRTGSTWPGGDPPGCSGAGVDLCGARFRGCGYPNGGACSCGAECDSRGADRLTLHDGVQGCRVRH